MEEHTREDLHDIVSRLGAVMELASKKGMEPRAAADVVLEALGYPNIEWPNVPKEERGYQLFMLISRKARELAQ